jgi:Mn2+/Fe2+ NRAMP family transporter
LKKSFLQSLGPGLLFAGAAIGVSHLVQSTRAGAEFGFGLIWALVLALLFKYPFFQFAPRYAAATGETLLEGYQKIGKGILIAFYALSFLTMFTIQAAVTIVTAGLATQLFGNLGVENNLVIWSSIITVVSLAILLIGKYSLLDNLMKYIIIVLSISTVIAVSVAVYKTNTTFSVAQIFPSGTVEITFLIAFLGWMPAPMDVAIWHSIWSVEKVKTTKLRPSPKEAVFDFNVGYLGILFLGVCFVLLGALVMYKSGETFSGKGSIFAQQLIDLYTKNLGNFSYIFIAIAAFTTMFSTTITTLDASPRAMSKTTELLFNKKIRLGYWFWIILLSVGTFLILRYFLDDMGLLIKIATVLSFLTAPFYAILNYIVITKHTPETHKPGKLLRALSILGIVFLIGFSIWFLFNV